MGEPLAPLLHLLVAVVVLPRLLGEVGEHGGQGAPAHVVTARDRRLAPANVMKTTSPPVLAPLVAADGGELADGLEQPGVGVAAVAAREEVLEVVLGEDELHPAHVVRVPLPLGRDLLDLVIVQGLHRLQHLPAHVVRMKVFYQNPAQT